MSFDNVTVHLKKYWINVWSK